MERPSLRLSAPLCAALAVVAVHLVIAGVWVLKHDLPTGGRDEFFIVEVATDIAYRMGEEGHGEIHPYLFDNAYYPPLVRLPAIAALVLGGGYSSIVFSGWVWLPFLLIPTWLIGRAASGSPWGGTAALAILLAAPGFVVGLHHYESNLGPMAMAACCFLVWLRSEHFTLPRYSFAFGLFLGLGLLSDRLGLIPFVLIPCLASLLATRSKKTVGGLSLAAIATAMTAGWWYLDFLDRFGPEILPQFLLGEIDRSGALIEGGSSGLGWWAHYLLLWPDNQMGLVAGGLALAGLFWATLKTRTGTVGGLLVWIIGGLLLFTLSQKRQVYYTLPLLPLVAVLASRPLVHLSRQARKTGPLLAAGVLALIQLPSFLCLNPELVDFAPGFRTWLLLNQSPLREGLMGERHALGGSPEASGLDLDGAVELVRQASGRQHPSLAVFSADNAQVTEHYQVVLGRMALNGMEVHGLTTHPEGFLSPGSLPDALLFVHRGGVDWPRRAQLVAAHESHDRWQARFEPLAKRLDEWHDGASLLSVQSLADGEQLSIWRLSP